MGKRKNLIGETFGWLKVLKPVESDIKYYNGKKQTRAKYLCQCKCGKQIEVLSGSLLGGLTKSCGCYRVYSGQKNANNLLGMTFGKLKVLSKYKSIKGKGVIWKCQCECGKITYVPTASLNNGNTQSCGCTKHPVASCLIGKKFSRLQVLDYCSKNSKAKNTSYICKCDCGNMKIATQIGLLSGKTQSCGCLHIETAKNNISNYCKRVDITGQRFGKLIAVKPTSDTKYNSVVWECKCDCGNVTYKTVGQLCRKNGTISCGCASSKGNVIINNLLKNTQTNFKAEYSFKDLRGVKGGLLRFDFAIFNTNQSIRYLIEYDGIFHFKQQYSNDSFQTTKIHDEFKNEYCKLHNINLIRISYLEKDNIENIIFGLLNEKSVA